jgi:hypothetical protein
MASNSNTKFHQPRFPNENLANGFVLGQLDLSESTISIHTGGVIPIQISEENLIKTIAKGVSLRDICFCSVYPKQIDRRLVLEISSILYPHEINDEFIDKFRLRGTIAKVSNELITIETEQKNRVKVYNVLKRNSSIDPNIGEFWEFFCTLNAAEQELTISHGIII